MSWECSECGYVTTRSRAPAKCQCCGIAGAVFVPTDEMADQHEVGTNLRDRWIELGVLGATRRGHSLVAA